MRLITTIRTRSGEAPNCKNDRKTMAFWEKSPQKDYTVSRSPMRIHTRMETEKTPKHAFL
jgi:hypothetical protein